MAAEDAPDAASPRLPSLTSLRWFAASFVFLRHASSLLDGTPLSEGYRQVAAQGTAGVAFFFVLSGFVLTWAHRDGDNARSFYRRRFARIAPAYWAACLLGVLSGITDDGISSSDTLPDLFTLTGLQALVPYEEIFYGGNGVAWSLSVEIFFYALFPLLIVPILRLGRRDMTVLLAGLVVLVVALPVLVSPDRSDPDFGQWVLYINPAARMLEFLIGVCLCCLLKGGVRVRIPLTAAVAALVVTLAYYVAADQEAAFRAPVNWIVIPLALVLFAAAQSDLAGRRSVLWSPVLIRLGQWSYCFYLMHILVIHVLERVADRSPSTGWHLAVYAAAYAGSTAAAYLLFRLVEEPFERRIRHGGSATPRSEREIAA